MSNRWDYQSGDWNINCDVCGRKIKASESRQRWDGFRVCADDWEMRHPQDFLRSKPEVISVPYTRKQPDVFITVPYGCTVEGLTAIAGEAVVNCSVVGDQ